MSIKALNAAHKAYCDYTNQRCDARGLELACEAYEAAKAADQPVERCERCNWPIVPEGEAGCWKSNCSMRPMPPLPQPVGMSANEVFENWAREHRKCLNLKRFHGGYEYSDTEFCWLAFQAAWQHKRESGTQWEYLHYLVGAHENQKDVLAAHGALGWELCTIDNHCRFYFKRKVTQIEGGK